MNEATLARWGIPAMVFSVKSFIAGMLAVYISFSIGLERPYWAFLTAYIVAAPLAGAVISKAMFRIVGTVIGAAAAIIMVSPLVHSPELLTLALAGWLGFCVFLSLLERTPRGYAFVLAGYTALLIVLPMVNNPGNVFNDAIARVQEITIGIVCSSLLHGVVFPRSVTRFLLSRVDVMLVDAERWSYDSLSLEPSEELEAERRRLAHDVTELHNLSTHLPYETSRPAPRVRTVRAMQDQLSLLLPLGATVADHIAAMRELGDLPEDAVQLLADAQAWLADIAGERSVREEGAIPLQERCLALGAGVSDQSDWADILKLSLGTRLHGLIEAHLSCRDLAEQLATHNRKPVSSRIPQLVEGGRRRELHRDVGGAFRAAIAAALTIIVGCALWIGSGWNDGFGAVMLAGIFFGLFSAADNPVAPLRLFFWGTLIATCIGLVYVFSIMPLIDGFPLFAMTLAPFLLVLGAFMYVPRYHGVALPALMGLGSSFIISPKFNVNFASFLNFSLAQLLGVVFAIVMSRLLLTVGLEAAIRRTLRATWIDIAERSVATDTPDVRGWINRVLDRISLLAPRLALSGENKGPFKGSLLYDVLRDLRTGIAVGELRELRQALPASRFGVLSTVMAHVSTYYRSLEPRVRPPADPILLEDIDYAIRAFLSDRDSSIRQQAVLPLVSLRRNLFPDAAAFIGVKGLS